MNNGQHPGERNQDRKETLMGKRIKSHVNYAQ